MPVRSFLLCPVPGLKCCRHLRIVVFGCALLASHEHGRSQDKSEVAQDQATARQASTPAVRVTNLPGVSGRPAIPAMAPPSVEFLPEPSTNEKEILAVLDKQVNFEFIDATLDEVRQHVIDTYQIKVFRDKERLEESSIDPTMADINVVLRGVSLRAGLNRILEPRDMNLVVQDDVLWWKKKAAAQEKKFTRLYPVRDLVGNNDADYELLRTAIFQGVGSPNEWKHDPAANGQCTVSIMPATGCLVVRQSWLGHDEVLQMLRNLRRANTEMKFKEEK